MSETRYWERTDSFEEKLRMLEAAWKRKDYRLARALAHSVRNTLTQAQAEEERQGTPLAGREDAVATLPTVWRAWAKGWQHYQTVTLDELTNLAS